MRIKPPKSFALAVLALICASLSTCADDHQDLQSLKSSVGGSDIDFLLISPRFICPCTTHHPENALKEGLSFMKPLKAQQKEAVHPPPSPPPLKMGESPWAVLMTRPDLGVMRRAVDLVPGLSDALRGKHVMATFFFPVNEAFEEVLRAGNLTLEEFMSDPISVRAVVLYHVADSQAYYR